MSYLLDKNRRRKKYLGALYLIVLLFILVYFRSPIYQGLSLAAAKVFRPVLVAGNGMGSKLRNAKSFFISKSSLLLENESLRREIDALSGRLVNYDALLDENVKLKEVLGRKSESQEMTLAAILAKPSRSPYDTLLVDAGEEEGIREGMNVFALGNIPIGRVAEVFPNSSKIILFSSPGEKTEVVIAGLDISMELVGRGGGNFEMILLRDFMLPLGTEVVLRGMTPHVVAVTEAIISDPRDSFQKALLVSPVNIQEQKFVEIELSRF